MRSRKKKEKRDKIRWELEGVYNIIYDYCSQDDNSSRAQKNVSNIKYIFRGYREYVYMRICVRNNDYSLRKWRGAMTIEAGFHCHCFSDERSARLKIRLLGGNPCALTGLPIGIPSYDIARAAISSHPCASGMNLGVTRRGETRVGKPRTKSSYVHS